VLIITPAARDACVDDDVYRSNLEEVFMLRARGLGQGNNNGAYFYEAQQCCKTASIEISDQSDHITAP